jgi:hypothetical protein
MSHGVQLPDLFETLTAEEAQREFYRELAAIRTLCLQLLAAEWMSRLERRQLMTEQALRAAPDYERTTAERNEWQAGDFIDYETA